MSGDSSTGHIIGLCGEEMTGRLTCLGGAKGGDPQLAFPLGTSSICPYRSFLDPAWSYKKGLFGLQPGGGVSLERKRHGPSCLGAG